MIDLGLIGEVMNLLYNVDSSISQLLVMLLVNLTQLDAGIASLLQVCGTLLQLPCLWLMLRRAILLKFVWESGNAIS